METNEKNVINDITTNRHHCELTTNMYYVIVYLFFIIYFFGKSIVINVTVKKK